MDLTSLTAISPIDGRYRKQSASLSQYFSEYGLIRLRVKVEIEYFLALCELGLTELKEFPEPEIQRLRQFSDAFGLQEAQTIKEIEATINHDVKAVEYFLKNHFESTGIGRFKEFIHFGLTSQDINNTAIPMSLKMGLEEEILPKLLSLDQSLTTLSDEGENIPMLARTHGQPASPTFLGKEILVFKERLSKQLELLRGVPYSGKFGGATGNFNAHFLAYPQIDWILFGNEFLMEKLGLKRSHPTTQIDHYDNLAALLDNLKRINTILIDFSQDMWHYVSLQYFTQKFNESEIGSSTMPHKVNPIDFENAEGNLGLANNLLEHLASKLPVSRLQRDLTDSTVLRSLGVPLAHSVIAYNSTMKGIGKLNINVERIQKDLDENWAVISEGIQTILRKAGFPEPYEVLKGLTRNNTTVDQKSLHAFIDSLEVTEQIKIQLKSITPSNYTGIY